MIPYDWPRAAVLGRLVPKNRIYIHGRVNTVMKDVFVREVDRIFWSHKLAPETVNLAATKQVTEIQVFRINARTTTLNHDVLRSIDRAIPFPLIFEVVHGGRVMLAATYKRPFEASSTRRWTSSNYFEGDWLPEDVTRVPLPVALDMGALYKRLLVPLVEGQMSRLIPCMAENGHTHLSPFLPDDPVSLETRIAKIEEIKAQARRVERIKSRMAHEKQFNRRVTINAELREAKRELRRLSS